jgi:hypothetical protein
VAEHLAFNQRNLGSSPNTLKERRKSRLWMKSDIKTDNPNKNNKNNRKQKQRAKNANKAKSNK